jgi:hypothetical protein
MNLTELIKNNTVHFDHYRKGFLYYKIKSPWEQPDWFIFTVPVDDCGDATFPAEEKAIMFLRYIRKAIENGELVRV